MCVHDTDSRGMCVKNGPHCAFAHGVEDVRWVSAWNTGGAGTATFTIPSRSRVPIYVLSKVYFLRVVTFQTFFSYITCMFHVIVSGYCAYVISTIQICCELNS